MANTYTQIHIQAVFAVQNRKSLIHQNWEDELYGYITGIVQNYGHKMLAINGMPDHVHLLFGFRPTQSLSELMQAVKGDSSRERIDQREILLARGIRCLFLREITIRPGDPVYSKPKATPQ